jgi:hypothetical protein
MSFLPPLRDKLLTKDQAWESLWQQDLPTISEFYNEDAEISGFSPPKQTTWKGLEAIKAVRKYRLHILRLASQILTVIPAKAF